MIKMLWGGFDAIDVGRYTGDDVIADNDQMIIDYPTVVKTGDYVRTVPVDKCSVCISDCDLTKYGFKKFGTYWYNTKFFLRGEKC